MKSLAKFSLLALLAVSAATAFADPATHGVRFDVDCSFGSVGCSAQSRIYKSWSDENATSIQPEWGGNLMAISCKGELVYANDSAVYIVTDNNGNNTWQIQGVNTYPLINLGDHPFDGSPNPKTAASNLDFGNGHVSSGSCTIDRVIF